MARSPERILRELGHVSNQLGEVEARRSELYAKRLALYQEARQLDPPVTNRVLAEATGVTEEAVIQVLRKAARQQGAA